MVQWSKHLTGLGKIVVMALVVAGVIAAIIVAYSLMGPTPVEEMTN